jgi:hypothetical protein
MRKKLLPAVGTVADHYRYLALEQLVIEACVEAHEYSSGTDPHRSIRDLDSEFLKALSGHRRQVEKVARFIRENAGRLGPALKRMHRVGGICIRYELRQPVGTAWSAVLSAYAAGLNPACLPARQGPFAHRFRDGPLDFGEAIDGRRGARIEAAETGLLFQLALYFRRYTAGVGREELGYMQSGEPMPEVGNPRWDLCGDIMAAIFGDRVPTTDDLRRRLGKLLASYRNLTFVGWPRAAEPKSKK